MWTKERWTSPAPFRSGLRKEDYSIRPRFDRSLFRVFFFTLIGACLILIYGTLIVTGKESSPLVKVQAGVIALATLGILGRLLGSAALRRRFRHWRLDLESSPVPRGKDVRWTLVVPPGGRPAEIQVERLCREAETLRDGADGNSRRWDRFEGRLRTLSANPCEKGWEGTLRIDEAEPGQADQDYFWRQWLLRVTVGNRVALFPLPDALTDTEIRGPKQPI